MKRSLPRGKSLLPPTETNTRPFSDHNDLELPDSHELPPPNKIMSVLSSKGESVHHRFAVMNTATGEGQNPNS